MILELPQKIGCANRVLKVHCGYEIKPKVAWGVGEQFSIFRACLKCITCPLNRHRAGLWQAEMELEWYFCITVLGWNSLRKNIPQIKDKTHTIPQGYIFNTWDKVIFPLFTKNSIMSIIKRHTGTKQTNNN